MLIDVELEADVIKMRSELTFWIFTKYETLQYLTGTIGFCVKSASRTVE